MPGPFGVTFAPTDDAAADAATGAAGRRQQAAVKVLSLAPPAVYSPNAFAPNALLQTPAAGLGAGVDPNKAVLASILRTLLGPNAGLPTSLPAELQGAGSVRESAISAPHVSHDDQPGMPLPSADVPPGDLSGVPPETPQGPFFDRTAGGATAPPVFDRTQPMPEDTRDMSLWRNRKEQPRTYGLYQS